MLKGNNVNKVVAAIVFVAALLFGQQLVGSEETVADDISGGETVSEVAVGSEDSRFSDLPTITTSELPDEAIIVLTRIVNDEPHTYDKDGSTFENREGLLPDQQVGHYQEFTVDTPGSSDRGARRIVTGQDGERFYTADHYGSFSEIVSE